MREDVVLSHPACSNPAPSNLSETCLLLLKRLKAGNLNEDRKKALHRHLQPALDLKMFSISADFYLQQAIQLQQKEGREYLLHNLKINTYKASLKIPLSYKITENFNFEYTSLTTMEY